MHGNFSHITNNFNPTFWIHYGNGIHMRRQLWWLLHFYIMILYTLRFKKNWKCISVLNGKAKELGIFQNNGSLPKARAGDEPLSQEHIILWGLSSVNLDN